MTNECTAIVETERGDWITTSATYFCRLNMLDKRCIHCGAEYWVFNTSPKNCLRCGAPMDAE